MPCPRCIERGKTWRGDDPKCFFDGNNNWNCSTLNHLRSISELHCDIQRMEDTSIAVIPFENDERIGWIVLSWYKSRGETGTALFVFDDESHTLTLDEAEACIEYYLRKEV